MATEPIEIKIRLGYMETQWDPDQGINVPSAGMPFRGWPNGLWERERGLRRIVQLEVKRVFDDGVGPVSMYVTDVTNLAHEAERFRGRDWQHTKEPVKVGESRSLLFPLKFEKDDRELELVVIGLSPGHNRRSRSFTVPVTAELKCFNDECPVCMESLTWVPSSPETQQANKCELWLCGHGLHYQCAAEYRQKTDTKGWALCCPICKQNVLHSRDPYY